jgi:ABC-2 type transport system permease protein
MKIKQFTSTTFEIIVREWGHFKKNNMLKLMLFGGPVLFPVVLGLVYINAKPVEQPITIVDLDNSSLSQRIIEALDENQYLRVYRVVSDEQAGIHDLKKGRIEGVVFIPTGFEGDIQQKRHPEIVVDLNSLNILTSNYINSGVLKTLGVINAGIEISTLQKSGVPANAAAKRFEAFGVQTEKFYNPETNYLTFLWPGVVGTSLQQIFLLVIALIFAYEFEKETFSALLKKTTSASHLIFAKSIPYFLIMMLIWSAMVFVLFPLFHVPIVGSAVNVLVFSALFMLSLLSLGVFVSCITRTMLLATDILMIISVPSFILSGFTWPVAQMPAYIQVISEILPLTPFLNGLRRLLFMQSSLNDVLPEIKSLAIMILVFGVLGWSVLKFKIGQYIRKGALTEA